MDGIINTFLTTFDLNRTDGIMILVFIPVFYIFWKSLERAVFKPYFDLFEARENATIGAQKNAQEQFERAESITQEYEKQITAQRVESVKEKLEQVQKAKLEASKIVEEATEKAQNSLLSARKETATRLASLKSSAQAEANNLAQLIVEKVKSATTQGKTKFTGLMQ